MCELIDNISSVAVNPSKQVSKYHLRDSKLH